MMESEGSDPSTGGKLPERSERFFSESRSSPATLYSRIEMSRVENRNGKEDK